VLLKHSQRNRSAAVRIPMYSPSPKTKRIEFRPPDPLANPYLAFAAMLMAGLDGIQRELDPGEPIDSNLYELPPEQLADIPTVPTSLDEALDALEADHAFLIEGEVFTEDLIETYVEFRREQSDRVKIRPHPYEFPLYFDG
jgi:glutamine synthetase